DQFGGDAATIEEGAIAEGVVEIGGVAEPWDRAAGLLRGRSVGMIRTTSGRRGDGVPHLRDQGARLTDLRQVIEQGLVVIGSVHFVPGIEGARRVAHEDRARPNEVWARSCERRVRSFARHLGCTRLRWSGLPSRVGRAAAEGHLRRARGLRGSFSTGQRQARYGAADPAGRTPGGPLHVLPPFGGGVRHTALGLRLANRAAAHGPYARGRRSDPVRTPTTLALPRNRSGARGPSFLIYLRWRRAGKHVSAAGLKWVCGS